MRIGYLEDDPDQHELIKAWLEEAGHSCVHYATGADFLRSLKRESFDLLIFDWLVPEVSGFEVLKHIRSHYDWPIPVLFVTQQEREQDIVDALRGGADDYMTKPVKRLELLARIDTLMRRSGQAQDAKTDSLDYTPYKIDLGSRAIFLNEEKISLTQKEYELAAFLFQNIGKIVSRNHLLETVWGTNPSINTRTVDTHASRIRTKLKLSEDVGYKLTSVYQHGYRLEHIEIEAASVA